MEVSTMATIHDITAYRKATALRYYATYVRRESAM
jgi:hypothetical protein